MLNVITELHLTVHIPAKIIYEQVIQHWAYDMSKRIKITYIIDCDRALKHCENLRICLTSGSYFFVSRRGFVIYVCVYIHIYIIKKYIYTMMLDAYRHLNLPTPCCSITGNKYSEQENYHRCSLTRRAAFLWTTKLHGHICTVVGQDTWTLTWILHKKTISFRNVNT